MRRGLGLTACLCLLLGASPAGAASSVENADELGRYRHDRAPQSPQSVAIEIRFGRYVPNADSDETLTGTPYKDVFGDGMRYSLGFEVDWQLLRIPYLGTLGPGFGASYTAANAKGLLDDGTRSAQTTSLEILPMYLVGVLRADVIARETPIPIVPYAKLGFGYAIWRASDAGDASVVDGVSGKGRSYGYQMALGGMLLLDVFDVQDARAADAMLGLNHSYLFGEWYVSKLDGFGGNHLEVGTNTWVVGLALEF